MRASELAVGVDRLDYTKGIVERLLAIEHLLETHPWHRERLTMVQDCRAEPDTHSQHMQNCIGA